MALTLPLQLAQAETTLPPCVTRPMTIGSTQTQILQRSQERISLSMCKGSVGSRLSLQPAMMLRPWMTQQGMISFLETGFKRNSKHRFPLT